MRRATLIRFLTGDHGTLGEWIVDARRLLYTCEPPWRNNESGLSCIPTGEYRVKKHKSPKFGDCYIVMGVQPREMILAHTGNVGGNIDKGFITHTHGCILTGLRLGRMCNQMAVVNSRYAFELLKRAMGDEFILRITGEFPAVN